MRLSSNLSLRSQNHDGACFLWTKVGRSAASLEAMAIEVLLEWQNFGPNHPETLSLNDILYIGSMI